MPGVILGRNGKWGNSTAKRTGVLWVSIYGRRWRMQLKLRGIATGSKFEGISEVHSLDLHGDAFVATAATSISFWTRGAGATTSARHPPKKY